MTLKLQMVFTFLKDCREETQKQMTETICALRILNYSLVLHKTSGLLPALYLNSVIHKSFQTTWRATGLEPEEGFGVSVVVVNAHLIRAFTNDISESQRKGYSMQ